MEWEERQGSAQARASERSRGHHCYQDHGIGETWLIREKDFTAEMPGLQANTERWVHMWGGGMITKEPPPSPCQGNSIDRTSDTEKCLGRRGTESEGQLSGEWKWNRGDGVSWRWRPRQGSSHRMVETVVVTAQPWWITAGLGARKLQDKICLKKDPSGYFRTDVREQKCTQGKTFWIAQH